MCLGELKCPSLEYVYDMTWAEFCIRLFAFRRQEKKSLYDLRFLAYTTLRAPYQDPKKIPKTIEKFLPMGDSKTNEINDLMKEKILEVKRKYQEQLSQNK